ncbi:MAG: tRNA (guanine37-N1)-methyltransferase [Parcubacteria group bacterium Athens1014_10]|nr:MAG: tRNA (guanine37-N1)-methyltransferase [Parcubacteria group bacterium Athens1014_10]TSD05934.1 MAG: tRNA (guanine37-N1)-methyltransferase [Parcubacteria group bacterium Athens0714_12]
MKFDILTIFPSAFDSYFNLSIIKRAQKKGLIVIKEYNIRDYTNDKHKKVDDKPYGGGPGMVMKIEPIYQALEAVKKKEVKFAGRKNKQKIILLSPRGKTFNQKTAEKYSKLDRIIFICGHYEGVDERVKKLIDEEISIGDYVLSGGELGAMVIIDAVTRLIPGVLGNQESLKEESFNQSKFKSKNLKVTLEYPQYTRPEIFLFNKNLKHKVPKILLSGDHKKIQDWREGRKKIKRK